MAGSRKDENKTETQLAIEWFEDEIARIKKNGHSPSEGYNQALGFLRVQQIHQNEPTLSEGSKAMVKNTLGEGSEDLQNFYQFIGKNAPEQASSSTSALDFDELSARFEALRKNPKEGGSATNQSLVHDQGGPVPNLESLLQRFEIVKNTSPAHAAAAPPKQTTHNPQENDHLFEFYVYAKGLREWFQQEFVETKDSQLDFSIGVISRQVMNPGDQTMSPNMVRYYLGHVHNVIKGIGNLVLKRERKSELFSDETEGELQKYLKCETSVQRFYDGIILLAPLVNKYNPTNDALMSMRQQIQDQVRQSFSPLGSGDSAIASTPPGRPLSVGSYDPVDGTAPGSSLGGSPARTPPRSPLVSKAGAAQGAPPLRAFAPSDGEESTPVVSGLNYVIAPPSEKKDPLNIKPLPAEINEIAFINFARNGENFIQGFPEYNKLNIKNLGIDKDNIDRYTEHYKAFKKAFKKIKDRADRLSGHKRGRSSNFKDDYLVDIQNAVRSALELVICDSKINDTYTEEFEKDMRALIKDEKIATFSGVNEAIKSLNSNYSGHQIMAGVGRGSHDRQESTNAEEPSIGNANGKLATLIKSYTDRVRRGEGVSDDLQRLTKLQKEWVRLEKLLGNLRNRALAKVHIESSLQRCEEILDASIPTMGQKVANLIPFGIAKRFAKKTEITNNNLLRLEAYILQTSVFLRNRNDNSLDPLALKNLYEYFINEMQYKGPSQVIANLSVDSAAGSAAPSMRSTAESVPGGMPAGGLMSVAPGSPAAEVGMMSPWPVAGAGLMSGAAVSPPGGLPEVVPAPLAGLGSPTAGNRAFPGTPGSDGSSWGIIESNPGGNRTLSPLGTLASFQSLNDNAPAFEDEHLDLTGSQSSSSQASGQEFDPILSRPGTPEENRAQFNSLPAARTEKNLDATRRNSWPQAGGVGQAAPNLEELRVGQPPESQPAASSDSPNSNGSDETVRHVTPPGSKTSEVHATLTDPNSPTSPGHPASQHPAPATPKPKHSSNTPNTPTGGIPMPTSETRTPAQIVAEFIERMDYQSVSHDSDGKVLLKGQSHHYLQSEVNRNKYTELYNKLKTARDAGDVSGYAQDMIEFLRLYAKGTNRDVPWIISRIEALNPETETNKLFVDLLKLKNDLCEINIDHAISEGVFNQDVFATLKSANESVAGRTLPAVVKTIKVGDYNKLWAEKTKSAKQKISAMFTTSNDRKALEGLASMINDFSRDVTSKAQLINKRIQDRARKLSDAPEGLNKNNSVWNKKNYVKKKYEEAIKSIDDMSIEGAQNKAENLYACAVAVSEINTAILGVLDGLKGMDNGPGVYQADFKESIAVLSQKAGIALAIRDNPKPDEVLQLKLRAQILQRAVEVYTEDVEKAREMLKKSNGVATGLKDLQDLYNKHKPVVSDVPVEPASPLRGPTRVRSRAPETPPASPPASPRAGSSPASIASMLGTPVPGLDSNSPPAVAPTFVEGLTRGPSVSLGSLPVEPRVKLGNEEESDKLLDQMPDAEAVHSQRNTPFKGVDEELPEFHSQAQQDQAERERFEQAMDYDDFESVSSQGSQNNPAMQSGPAFACIAARYAPVLSPEQELEGTSEFIREGQDPFASPGVPSFGGYLGSEEVDHSNSENFPPPRRDPSLEHGEGHEQFWSQEAGEAWGSGSDGGSVGGDDQYDHDDTTYDDQEVGNFYFINPGVFDHPLADGEPALDKEKPIVKIKQAKTNVLGFFVDVSDRPKLIEMNCSYRDNQFTLQNNSPLKSLDIEQKSMVVAQAITGLIESGCTYFDFESSKDPISYHAAHAFIDEYNKLNPENKLQKAPKDGHLPPLSGDLKRDCERAASNKAEYYNENKLQVQNEIEEFRRPEGRYGHDGLTLGM